MNRNRKWTLLNVFATLGLLIGGFGFTQAKAETIDWHVQNIFVPGSLPNVILFERMPELIEQATKGRLKIIEAKGLVKYPQILDAVRDGRLKGGSVPLAYVGGMSPADVTDLPGMFNDEASRIKWINETGYHDIIKEELRKQFDIEVMLNFEMGYDAVFFVDPVRTFDDFKGKKIRAFGRHTLVVLEHLGAAPLNVPWGEVYLGLETGLLDGAITGLVSGVGSNFHDKGKHIFYGELGGATTMIFPVSGEAWRALPDDLKPKVQQVFDELQAEYEARSVGWTEKLMDKARADGAEIVFPTPEELAIIEPAAKRLANEWRERVAKVGYEIPNVWKEYLTERGLWDE